MRSAVRGRGRARRVAPENSRPVTPRLAGRPALWAGVALLAAGCMATPGVGGVQGTAESSSSFWVPPVRDTARRTARPPATLPADIESRVDSLALTDLIDIALTNNTTTRASWESARAAAYAYGSARGAWLPTVDGQVDVNTLKTAASQGRSAVRQTIYGPSVNLSWTLLDFGGRSGSIGRARNALLAADWTHNATIQNVVLQVESAYFQYLATRALLEAQRTSLREARRNLEAARERHAVGVATMADTLKAQTAVSQAQLALETTQGQLATTRGALAVAMGLPANVSYDVRRSPGSAPPLRVAASVDSLIDRALLDRPDLAAARAQAAAADAGVAQARGALLPRIVASGQAAETYFANTAGGRGSYSGSLAIQIPLFSGFSRHYELQAAQATARASHARAEGLAQQVVYQVFASYNDLKTATQRVRTSGDLLASARQSEEAALAQYREGVGSLLDLLSAQSALADARAQEIDARWSWYIALAQLAHDAGLLDLKGGSAIPMRPDTAGGP
ncbi:MAG: TolC family protein [Candidatus Palauibacterales bacterium]|nr:TolC family protein [Candidatus Palauibacterales bacterium]MDP2583333.1 TolC family protein [Candidatus Palauibacterales bacterium]